MDECDFERHFDPDWRHVKTDVVRVKITTKVKDLKGGLFDPDKATGVKDIDGWRFDVRRVGGKAAMPPL